MYHRLEWHEGPPPHVGWWNASALKDCGVWRWWDGRQWSEAALNCRSAEEAAQAAAQPIEWPPIRWTHYWPQNARVPRVDPGF